MSHGIEMNQNGKHEVFTKGKSWHGLGQVVKEAQTFDEALKLGQLDWEVRKADIYADLPDDSDRIKVEGNYGIQRMDSGRVLGVVGSRYEPMQNRDALAFFESFVDQGDAIFESAGAINGGKRVWMSAKLPDHIQVAGDKSGTELYAVAINSHDGSTAITLITTPIRIVCNNTMRLALKVNNGMVKIRHTKSATERMNMASEALGITNAYWAEMSELFMEMGRKSVNQRHVDMVKEMLYPKTKKEGEWVLSTKAANKREDFESDLFNYTGQDVLREGTGWWLYNGVTGHLDNRSREGSEFKVLTDLDGIRNKAVDIIMS